MKWNIDWRSPHLYFFAATLLPFVLSAYSISIVNYILLATLVVLGFVVMTGAAGIISFGQAAFVGVGAYLTLWLTAVLGLSPWLSLPLCLVVGLATSAVVGAVALTMSGHFLALGTLSFALGLYYVFGNLPGLGNFNGMGGLPPLSVADFAFDTDGRFYYLVLGIVAVCMVGVSNLLDSRIGRALRSLRYGRTISESVGANSTMLRLLAFVVAGLLATLSGWLYAHMQRFINPTPFAIDASIEYLFMAVIGGVSGLWGAPVGAATVIILQRGLDGYLPQLLGYSMHFAIPVFGVLMLAVLQLARAGLWPRLVELVGQRSAPPVVAAVAPFRRSAAASGPVLEVDGAVKRFGGLVAVDQISFVVAAGEIVGLVGPNGAGKSTMFNLVTGLLPLTAGEIRFRGRRIDRLPSRRIAALGIARTFQHVKLVPTMSVLENVALGGYQAHGSGPLRAILRLDRPEETVTNANAAAMLERVGLADMQQELAANLPLGKQRLLEIARSMAANPLLLLLDEPAAGLRYQEKRQLADLVLRLGSEGLSILVVEHDMDFIQSVASRLVVMQYGRRIAEGTPAQVRSDPEVQIAYLGAD